MEISVVHTCNPVVATLVDFFLFFRKQDTKLIRYNTFPNINICLAIYKHNQIERQLDHHVNNCQVKAGGDIYTSRLWGFHSMPFSVEVAAPIDQICINFKAGALRNFTSKPYGELILSDKVFEDVFGRNSSYFIEYLFETSDLQKRASLLENFLYKKMNNVSIDYLLESGIRYILTERGNVRINELADTLQINSSTLYRKFTYSVGQSPKHFIKTVRFRDALSSLLKEERNKLVHVSNKHNYYDQAHFIKDFTKLAGFSPKEIRKGISVFSNQFILKKNNLT